MLTFLVAFAAALSGAVLAWFGVRRRPVAAVDVLSELGVRVLRPAIVTLKAGSSFRGVLYSKDGEALVLRNVEHLVEGADLPTPVDGELVVLLANVDFMQFI